MDLYLMNQLIEEAKKAREFAHAKYSNFKVGAAFEADGRIYRGSNVESSSYGLSICAERVALTKALSEGAKSISRIAIIADTKAPVSPCGACRQLLLDYAPDAEVIMTNLQGDTKVMTVSELLPFAFSDKDLKG